MITKSGTNRSPIASAILAAYRTVHLRRAARKLALVFEDGEFYSDTLREILSRYHGVEVGAYSYGPVLRPEILPRGSFVGRFVSVANTVRMLRRNHPVERLSMHPFFYNADLGFVEQDTIENVPLRIEHDAWIGHNASILTGCRRIGLGAVVGAGAIVTKDVPDFAIVGGNPAKVIRYRFSEDIQAEIHESRWWVKTVDQLMEERQTLIRPVAASSHHPLISEIARGSELVHAR